MVKMKDAYEIHISNTFMDTVLKMRKEGKQTISPLEKTLSKSTRNAKQNHILK